ncbi:MAG: hypothetical protein M1818_003342 [Claussenomyces sp. TS43310]|nr:MAG: hypothetical protein M1818_003342 [Claussenomyces sp. TS43310]
MREIALHLTDLLDLAIILITAGADVYAYDNDGDTPSDFAEESGMFEIWTEALSVCGYDSEKVFSHDPSERCNPTSAPQTSQMSFVEYCQQRPPQKAFADDMRFSHPCPEHMNLSPAVHPIAADLMRRAYEKGFISSVEGSWGKRDDECDFESDEEICDEEERGSTMEDFIDFPSDPDD